MPLHLIPYTFSFVRITLTLRRQGLRSVSSFQLLLHVLSNFCLMVWFTAFGRFFYYLHLRRRQFTVVLIYARYTARWAVQPWIVCKFCVLNMKFTSICGIIQFLSFRCIYSFLDSLKMKVIVLRVSALLFFFVVSNTKIHKETCLPT